MNNAFEDDNKSSGIDLSKIGTEGNYSLVELDTLKGLKADEKRRTFDRRKGNRKQGYVEALTGNSICRRKIQQEENQINILSTFNDDNLSGYKVSTTAEIVEEIRSTKFDD